jgi:ethanolamine transporter EutH
MIAAMVVGKLIGGITAVALAVLITPKEPKQVVENAEAAS